MTRVRVALPAHLRTLAGTGSEVVLELPDAPTIRDLIDALEADFPVLAGTVRDRATGERRAFMRYFACGEDVSHEPQDTPLPDALLDGREVFQVIGAIAGG